MDFSANGITAEGLKALDGILQSNIALKTLNLSGNAINDEGAKVFLHFSNFCACVECSTSSFFFFQFPQNPELNPY